MTDTGFTEFRDAGNEDNETPDYVVENVQIYLDIV